MGVGIYYSTDGISVLTEGPLHNDELDYSENVREGDFFYGQLIIDIREVLPKTYSDIDLEKSDHGEGIVIAENSFYEVSIVPWECDYAIVVHPTQDDDYEEGYHPLAVANLSRAAHSIFSKLSQLYELRVRTSGYTTGKYIAKAA
jgi:hypothetical protein